MRTVTASQAKQGFAEVLDAAAREPVVIRRHNRDVAVVISMHDYERLHRLNVEEFLRVADEIGREAVRRGLTEEKLAALLASDD
ncbi:MAG: type II toxin-antitoxin system Phd/YefM family antitoxin [Proteobacteria bacterium]|nr:type II toxin-antitoxin system Phd/YefM family antitoxin [Pseudomonadota bacterium]